MAKKNPLKVLKMKIDREYVRKYLTEKKVELPDDIIPITVFPNYLKVIYNSLIRDILKQNFNDQISSFIPGKQFVSLSVTGSACDLNCEHCHTHYLSHMTDVSSEEKLRETLDSLIEQGVLGCLISGGCDSEGKVPLLRFHQILKEYKEKSSLIFNFHVGLIDEEEIQKIAEIQPDFVSFDLTLDDSIIKNVYHLNRKVEDYLFTFKKLIEHGVRTIPHICVGLNFGNMKKEYLALQEIAKYPVDMIVFLVIIPPPEHEVFHRVNPMDVSNLFTTARLLFPQKELSLGCMRPRDKFRHLIEEYAVRAGFNRFEIPSKKTLKLLKEKGLSVQTYNVCCAVSKSKLHSLSKP
jgi:uncharacterized radical SAM superfamily protein